MRRGCASRFPACAAVTLLLVCAPATAQDSRARGSVFEVPLPGGIRAALSALDDRATPDRGQFLLEVIRRFHAVPFGAEPDPRLAPLRSLVAHLDAPGTGAAPDTLPLPLPPAVWIDEVFGGRATLDTLVAAILHSRSASLLYCGLLSLDDETRGWLATRRDLVRYLASTHAAAFLVAAPGLRVRNGRMELPGGDAVRAAWVTLAGTTPDEPVEFIRKIVELRQGRLAYFVGAMSSLSADQMRLAFRVDAADPQAPVAAVLLLDSVFERIARDWNVDRLPFWRPALDPALLLSDLRSDEHGRPSIPGTSRFWSEVFADEAARKEAGTLDDGADARTGARVDFGWLCDRVFVGPPREHARSYNMVLFASRHLAGISLESNRDALDTVRAAGQYPALVASLERAKLADLGAFAAVARRAARLNAIADRAHAVPALLQFQGALALITRAAVRGGLPAGTLARLVSSLSAVDVTEAGDYDGGLVRWIDAELLPLARTGADPQPTDGDTTGAPGGYAGDRVQHRLLRLMSGPSPGDGPLVDWEGTRYRVDLAAAEATRLAQILGDAPPPLLSSARELVMLADALQAGNASIDRLRAAAATLAAVGRAIQGGPTDDEARRAREVGEALQRAARSADPGMAARHTPALRTLADGLVARGLLDLAYAAALGQPGAIAISVDEAASRHDFGPARWMRSIAWQLPYAASDPDRGWHVTGSLLGLDIRLAEFSLLRVSSRPPPSRPSLSSVDRRVFTEAVALVDPATLSDAGHDALIAALGRGRARVASARSPSDVLALADDLHVSAARRTLLAWSAVHEPGRVPRSITFTELVRLGAEPTAPDGAFDAWGAAGEPRLGCLCLRLSDRTPWEALAGRWNTGIFATGFPDLNLHLAELLDELRMPAALLGHVLASATVDFVENATSRDPDDGRGLVEFVQGLSRDRVEEYLALLTTDGPLVPVGDAVDPAPRRGSPR